MITLCGELEVGRYARQVCWHINIVSHFLLYVGFGMSICIHVELTKPTPSLPPFLSHRSFTSSQFLFPGEYIQTLVQLNRARGGSIGEGGGIGTGVMVVWRGLRLGEERWEWRSDIMITQILTFGRDTESAQKGSKVKEVCLHLWQVSELQSCPTNTSNKSDVSSSLYHRHHFSGLEDRDIHNNYTC